MSRLSAQQAILVRRTALGLAHRRQGETGIRALARMFLAIMGAETDDAARRSADLLSEIAPELLRRAQRALADTTVHYLWQQGRAQRYHTVAATDAEKAAWAAMRREWNTLGNTARHVGPRTKAGSANPNARKGCKSREARPARHLAEKRAADHPRAAVGCFRASLQTHPPAEPMPPAPRGASRARRVEFPRAQAAQSLQATIEAQRRAPAYSPVDLPARLQLLHLVRLRLGQHLEEGQAAVFQTGPVFEAEASATRAGRMASGARLAAVDARRMAHTEVSPTPRASATGHLWCVWRTGAYRTRVAPLCQEALSELMGMGQAAVGAEVSAALQAAAHRASDAQWRALMGQAVHGATARVATEAWISPALARSGRESARMVALGAGAGIWAMAVWSQLQQAATAAGSPCPSYLAYAEAQGTADEAHRAGWAVLGQDPARLGMAHTQATVDAMPLHDLCLVSLGCSPFSPANRSPVEDAVDDHMRELAGTMRAAVRGEPAVIVVENSGALSQPAACEWRQRMLLVLTAAVEYAWVWAEVCPLKHAGFPVGRSRTLFRGERHRVAMAALLPTQPPPPPLQVLPTLPPPTGLPPPEAPSPTDAPKPRWRCEHDSPGPWPEAMCYRCSPPDRCVACPDCGQVFCLNCDDSSQ